jgi:tetratricopeptide (TPR) repeat protein
MINIKYKIKIFYLFSFFFCLIYINCDIDGMLIKKHYDKGLEYASQGKFEEAKQEFESALKIDTFKIYIEYNIIIIHDVGNQFIKKEVAIHLFRAIVFNEKAEYDLALEEVNKAIQINPEYAMLYNRRGVIYYDKHEYEKAIVDYNKAIDLNQELTINYYNRALAYDESGQKLTALKEYKLFIEIASPKYKRYVQYSQWRVEQLKGLTF